MRIRTLLPDLSIAICSSYISISCYRSDTSFIPHICHFSPHVQFLVQFSPHKSAWIATKYILQQKSVNCDKPNFTTKQNKFYVCRDILHITHMPDVEKFQISPNLSYGEIGNCSTSGETADLSTSVTFRNLKCLHMTYLFSTDTLVINMKYDQLLQLSL